MIRHIFYYYNTKMEQENKPKISFDTNEATPEIKGEGLYAFNQPDNQTSRNNDDDSYKAQEKLEHNNENIPEEKL